MKILNIILKTLLLLGTLAYLVFALVKVSRPTEEMVCTGVEIQIADSGQICLIDKAGIETYLAKQKISPKGRTLADVDIKGVEAKLSANPYIDTVNVFHTATGKLCIRVRPYHPMLHIMAQDGDEFYIDDNGTIIPASDIATELPIVTGYVTRSFASTHLITMGKYLRDDKYWHEQTQQIDIDKQGRVELIPRFADQHILLGEPKNIADKLTRVRMFYDKAMPKAGWNKYKTINATYKGQIICTKQ